MALHPTPDGSQRAPDPATDELVNGPITGHAVCAHCGQNIVRMPAGHWRLAVNDQTIDRIHCRETKQEHHRPPCDSEGRAILKRVSAPWSDASAPELRTGDLP